MTPKLAARRIVATVAVQAFHLLRTVSIEMHKWALYILVIIECLPP
jgi:hypothetical protein